jgi:hypothetical protein
MSTTPDPYTTPEKSAHPESTHWADPAPAGPSNGMAVASLVLGICGLAFSWILFGIPSILAVIFGHIGYAQHRQRGGKGMAITGLATGYTAIGLFALLIAFGMLGAFST